MLVLALAALLSLPHVTHAAAVSVTAFTATSTPVYVNTGLATTSRAKVGDTVQFQLTLSGTPLIAPQINIFQMGSTTMSGSGASYWYATTTTSVWTEGPIAFRVSVGGTTGAEATTTQTAVTSGANVTFDKTGPTLSSVTWNDVDGSTEFSVDDTLVFGFSETMATTTITTGNADTTLGLSGSHTFGTSPTIAWNTAGNVLTLTLKTGFTVASGDTVDPTSAVKDAIGNADATVSPLTITDNLAPAAPTGLTDTNFAAFATISLSSPAGSSQVRYTTDGTSPTCSTGTVYTTSFDVTSTQTVKAVACDTAGNASSIASATYTRHTSGGGGGGSSGTRHNGSSVTTAVAASVTGTTNVADLMAKIELLKTQLAALTGDAGGAGSFGRDLDIGSEGADVTALQKWLIGKGYAIAAGATGHFGAQTQAALAAYQKAVGITPAVGYFGPKTRAVVGH